MKFDTIIIGGGLTGLTCAIALQKSGVRCAVISAGQSALHFSSGSFDLLNYAPDGSEVSNPAEVVPLLPECHPYRKLGAGFCDYADKAKELLLESGIPVEGDSGANHFRYTPMGGLKPTWLTLSEFAFENTCDGVPSGKTLIVNFSGFLDFNTKFIADSFSLKGVDCSYRNVSVKGIDRLRKSPTEMRASNIARALENEETFNELLAVLKQESVGYDNVVLPAVFGLTETGVQERINSELAARVWLLPTMPPSVPGIRTQMTLRRVFEKAGGVYILGDTVRAAVVEDDRVKSLYTANHGDTAFVADNFVLATGHFFSGGLVASMDTVREPVFGCDVDYIADRGSWYESQAFGAHNYLSFGVAYNEEFRLRKAGVTYRNLYGAGSVLGGSYSRTEGSGAGVSMLTALRVADLIKGRE